MTSPNLLLPLRIPELGPSLGKLVTDTGNTDRRLPLDAFRFQLASKIIAHAGEARRLVSNDEREAAIGALGRGVWLTAWEETVNAVAATLIDRLNDHLEDRARAVRMPLRHRRRIQLDPSEQRALRVRLGSAGAAIIPALDALDAAAMRALHATARDRESMDVWQDTLLVAARRLESSWVAVEVSVGRELDEWLTVADQVSRWRRPVWPVIVFGSLAIAGTLWVGLMRGGMIATPEWFRALTDFVNGVL